MVKQYWRRCLPFSTKLDEDVREILFCIEFVFRPWEPAVARLLSETVSHNFTHIYVDRRFWPVEFYHSLQDGVSKFDHEVRRKTESVQMILIMTKPSVAMNERISKLICPCVTRNILPGWDSVVLW